MRAVRDMAIWGNRDYRCGLNGSSWCPSVATYRKFVLNFMCGTFWSELCMIGLRSAYFWCEWACWFWIMWYISVHGKSPGEKYKSPTPTLLLSCMLFAPQHKINAAVRYWKTWSSNLWYIFWPNLVVKISIDQVHPSNHDGKLFYTCNDVLAKNAFLVVITLVYLGYHEIPYHSMAILVVILMKGIVNIRCG